MRLSRQHRHRGSGVLVWSARVLCLVVLLAAASLPAQGPTAPAGPAPDAQRITVLAQLQPRTPANTPASPPPAPAPAPTVAPRPAGQPDDAGPPRQPPTLLGIYRDNLAINIIITLLSILGLTLFIYYLFTINTHAMMPRLFIDEVTRLIVARRYTEAADFCRRNQRCLAASILQRCLENADKDQQTLMQMIESEGQRRADLVWNRISYLIDLSSIAPMLGLLGTVLRMIDAFRAIPETAPGVGLHTASMSYAIGGAMGATLFGLAVAILCVAFHSIVKAQAVRSLAVVEQVVHSLADHIKRSQP